MLGLSEEEPSERQNPDDVAQNCDNSKDVTAGRLHHQQQNKWDRKTKEHGDHTQLLDVLAADFEREFLQ